MYCLSFFDLRLLMTSLIFRSRNRLVVGLKTTYAISAYHHYSCEVKFAHGEMYSIQPYVIKFVSDLLILIRKSTFCWTILQPYSRSILSITRSSILTVSFVVYLLQKFVFIAQYVFFLKKSKINYIEEKTPIIEIIINYKVLYTYTLSKLHSNDCSPYINVHSIYRQCTI